MLAKAIIATLLGAGVTGGAVYLAANPDVLEPKAKAERVVPEPADAPKNDITQIDNMTPDVQPDDNTPTITLPETAPVLPEAKQLTTRTVITPASDRPQSDDGKPVAIISAAENSRDINGQSSDRMPADAAQAGQDEAAHNHAQDDLDKIMTQAARMASPDLRDQAHLSAVDFALSSDNFDGASRAMEMLSQPQLRDTARSKIAVKYARSGQTDMAFEIIDAVEIDDLRDFMRLQVIEAITAGP